MLLTLLSFTTLAFSPGYSADNVPSSYWRSPLRCGPNCLYAYLSLHGCPVPLEAVSDRVPIDGAGANLADLRKAAAELGVSSRVVQLEPAELCDLPLPAIAHLDTPGGHFVLILQADSEQVITSDMTNGRVDKTPTDAFIETWSGFALVRVDPGRRFPWTLVASLSGLGGIAFLVRHRTFKKGVSDR